MTAHRTPVSADDLDEVIALALAALGNVGESDWKLRAGDLAWSCRETVQHISRYLLTHATQLTGRAQSGYVPLEFSLAGEPDSVGLLSALHAAGGILGSVVRTTPAEVQVWHPFGFVDPEAAAAIAIVETALHTHDICHGLGLPWGMPEAVCHRVLARLFPDAPASGERWAALLWCTGRIALPGYARRTQWSWSTLAPHE